jgi:hypothetical protein
MNLDDEIPVRILPQKGRSADHHGGHKKGQAGLRRGRTPRRPGRETGEGVGQESAGADHQSHRAASDRPAALGERSRVELLKLAATLLIAVFGVITGARDQIARLDVPPGLVAVLLIGVGADTIKSPLSTRS